MAFPGAKWLSGSLQVEEDQKKLREEVHFLRSTVSELTKKMREVEEFIKQKDLALAIEDNKRRQIDRKYYEDKNLVYLEGNAAVIGSGIEGTGKDQFKTPMGIAIYPRNENSSDFKHGLVFVVDCDNHRVQVYGTKPLQHMYTIGTGIAGNGKDQLNTPKAAVILLPSINCGSFPYLGLLYVSDTKNNRVQVFNVETRELHLSIVDDSSLSYGDGDEPWGLAIIQPNKDFPEGLLFIGYRYSIRVVVRYATSGRYRHEFPVYGDDPGNNEGPRGIAVQMPTSVSPDYLLIVTNCDPMYASSIHIFNALSGSHLKTIDSNALSGIQLIFGRRNEEESIFDQPYDVAVMPANSKYPNGAIYLASHHSQNVAVFDATTYQLINRNILGDKYPEAWGLAVCRDSKKGTDRNIVFVSDVTTNTVQIIIDE
jgi:DNA-binding beta-propeller fold protein YncE